MNADEGAHLSNQQDTVYLARLLVQGIRTGSATEHVVACRLLADLNPLVYRPRLVTSLITLAFGEPDPIRRWNLLSEAAQVASTIDRASACRARCLADVREALKWEGMTLAA